MTVEELTKKLSETRIAIVDFYATWCGPCKVISPVLDDIKKENSEVGVIKIDIEDNDVLCDEFSVRSVPTLLFFKEGELVDMTVGNVPKNEILKRINNLK